MIIFCRKQLWQKKAICFYEKKAFEACTSLFGDVFDKPFRLARSTQGWGLCSVPNLIKHIPIKPKSDVFHFGLNREKAHDEVKLTMIFWTIIINSCIIMLSVIILI